MIYAHKEERGRDRESKGREVGGWLGITKGSQCINVFLLVKMLLS